MADEEDYDLDVGTHGNEDDLSLPKATVAKMIAEMLPSEVQCARETRDLFGDACIAFIHLLASQANALCDRDKKSTITAEHILESLPLLGFTTYLPAVQEAYEEHKSVHSKEREKRVPGAKKWSNLGLSQEELLREQEALFEKARERYQAQQQEGTEMKENVSVPVPPPVAPVEGEEDEDYDED